ncbi:MAG: energy-coupled thiamine transporter ThiT [Clostridia bacterium]|nr:energy-coupled thiamine transporter ThiT [Clostridia bacterium]
MKSTAQKTQRLAVCGIMIALSVVLSIIKVFALPFGGSVTLFSMVPIMLTGFLYGTGYGILCGFINGIFQCILGISSSGALAGLSFMSAALMICLDYFIAFSAVGTAGIFKKHITKPAASLCVGSVFASFLRFVTHTVSGVILYGSYAEYFFSQEGFFSWGETILSRYSGITLSLIYSLIYNASYMLPEAVLSAVACMAIISVKPVVNTFEKYKQ